MSKYWDKSIKKRRFLSCWSFMCEIKHLFQLDTLFRWRSTHCWTVLETTQTELQRVFKRSENCRLLMKMSQKNERAQTLRITGLRSTSPKQWLWNMCTPLLLVLVTCVLSVHAEASCPSCERGHEEGELLEAVKRHILSRLQLDARPNITQTLPRAAMLTALRRLHAGRLRQDGRIELPTDTRVPEDSSEIISFAEKGTALSWVS